jgi:hypothetical protein
LTDSTAGTLSGYLEYRTGLFDQGEIAGLVKQFVDLVGEVAEAPDSACISVPPVAEVEENVPPSKSPSSEAANDSRGSFIKRLSSAFSSRSRQ